MKRALAAVVLIALVVGGAWFYHRWGRTNAYYAQQRMDRFGAMAALSFAFREYADAHDGIVPDDLRVAASASEHFSGTFARDAKTYRTLDRAVLLRDVAAKLPRVGDRRYEWLVVLFIPEATLPNHPADRRGEDCVYWFGREASGSNRNIIDQGQLYTLPEAQAALGAAVVETAKRKYREAGAEGAERRDNPPMQRTGAASIVSVVRTLPGRGSGR